MKYFIKVIGIGFALLFLSACNESEQVKYDIVLMNGEEMVLDIDAVENQVVSLEDLEQDGMIFAGWSDGSDIFNKELIVTKTITLNPVFEDISSIFEIEKAEDGNQLTAGITKYNGEARYLQIPQMIDGYIITEIKGLAFENSHVIEVDIPIDAFVGMNAFKGSSSLKKITLYGDYLLDMEDMVSVTEYNDILSEYSAECTKINETSDTWEFNEGCPIRKVLEKTEPLIISGVEFYMYKVIRDIDFYESISLYNYSMHSLKDLQSLESVEISYKQQVIFANTFEGCTGLKEIIIDDDSQYYSVLDNVVYTKDMKTLVFYPEGLEDKEFRIPDGVEEVREFSFLRNTNIEKIIIPKDYHSTSSFPSLSNLKEFYVEDGNTVLRTIDGVLYSGDSLIKYPAQKLGSSFTVPAGITVLGPFSFEKNKYLETIDFGTEIIEIGSRAFEETELLHEINLPSTTNLLGMYILLDSSVEEIVINAEEVVLWGGSLDPRRDIEDITIYVPEASVQNYKGAMSWKNYADVIFPISTYTNNN